MNHRDRALPLSKQKSLALSQNRKQRGIDLGTLLLGGSVQNKIADRLLQVEASRMPDSDPKPPVMITCKALADVFESVMACRPAAELELCHTREQVKFVVRYEDFIGLDFVEVAQGEHCLSRAIHPGAGFEQEKHVPVDPAGSGFAKEFGLAAKSRMRVILLLQPV